MPALVRLQFLVALPVFNLIIAPSKKPVKTCSVSGFWRRIALSEKSEIFPSKPHSAKAKEIPVPSAAL